MSDLVKIVWKAPDSTWPYFRLIGTKPHGWLKLKGADYPDGSIKHDGDTFLAHRDEIVSIVVI